MSNLREYFCDAYLGGIGLELGPLHKPLPKHGAMRVRYIDRYNKERLKEHYPELADEIIIEPDIIDDVQLLEKFKDSEQDFVITAHIIEHMKNPILALENWLRILLPGGYLYLVVPDHRKIFDKDRPTTDISHLLADYHAPNSERDRDHYFEYGGLVDHIPMIQLQDHVQHLIDTDYSIHFHCFTPSSMFELLTKHILDVNFKIIEGPVIDEKDPHEFHFLLRKENV